MKPSLAPEENANAIPSHDEIAECARELWSQSERPEGRDEEIWLEAERRLASARHVTNVGDLVVRVLSRTDAPQKRERAFAGPSAGERR